FGFADEQPLPLPLGASAAAHQPGRHHPRVVQDQQIPRRQQLGQVGEDVVRQSARRPFARAAKDQQPGPVPPRRRFLRDEMLGKTVIEVARMHRRPKGGFGWWGGEVPPRSSTPSPPHPPNPPFLHFLKPLIQASNSFLWLSIVLAGPVSLMW